jgi:hypothetical protein
MRSVGAMRRLRPTLAILAVVALAGCTTGTKDVGTQAPGNTGVATASPSAAASPSPIVTRAPTPTLAPTPGQADVSIVKQIVHAWPSSGSYVSYQVIIEVKNNGSGWADMIRGSSDYTVYDKDGGVTATGSSPYAYPRYLGPGETGYLLAAGIEDGVKVAAFATVDASSQYKPVDEPGPKLTTAKINLKAEAYSGSVAVTGTVTNTSSVDVARAVIGVIMFDSAGNPLCYDYTNLVNNINAGQTKGFSASGSAPVTLKQIATTLAFASSMDY